VTGVQAVARGRPRVVAGADARTRGFFRTKMCILIIPDTCVPGTPHAGRSYCAISAISIIRIHSDNAHISVGTCLLLAVYGDTVRPFLARGRYRPVDLKS